MTLITDIVIISHGHPPLSKYPIKANPTGGVNLYILWISKDRDAILLVECAPTNLAVFITVITEEVIFTTESGPSGVVVSVRDFFVVVLASLG